MQQPDILVYISDQHNANITGFAGDKLIDTPNLNRIAAQGTVINAAYTACPLCGPARMSMLSAALPSRTGIFANEQPLSSDTATFVHALANHGYETVLCGRMHFNGPDQRHGFQRRIIGDITCTLESMGPHFAPCGDPRSIEDAVIGGGDSPVLAFDRAVTCRAVEHLQSAGTAPQLLVVGTYGPHHPYVAPPELYTKYKARMTAPVTLSAPVNHSHPALKNGFRNYDAETVLRARAAYYGMIEQQDRHVGEVYDAWTAYLARMKRDGIFVYLSDHGDMIGEHNLWSKCTFFEGSARIPLIFQGAGIRQNCVVDQAASIIDLGPTLLALTGAEPLPNADGRPLLSAVTKGQPDDRAAISEFYAPGYWKSDGYGRMVRRGPWKLISYHGYDADLLFNIARDPLELTNVIAEHSDVAEALRQIAWGTLELQRVCARYQQTAADLRVTRFPGSCVLPPEERVPVPKESTRLPEVV